MKKLVIGNWKLNNNLEQTKKYFSNFPKNAITNIDYGIAPNFIFIDKIPKSFIRVAQNMSLYEKGAFTGETSIDMLKSIDTKMVIIGHSERRVIFNETDQELNQKVKLALNRDIKPIFCVGESLEQFENNQTEQVIEKQISLGLKDVDFSKIIIAYEPIWAIGTGKVATVEQVSKICNLIRKLTHIKTIIQYGGSVNVKNVKSFLNEKNINGFLVGGSSVNPMDFYELLKMVSKNV